MAVCAVAAQSYPIERLHPARLHRWTRRGFLAAVILGLVLIACVTLFVTAVPYEGGDRVARYVTGFHQRLDCPCKGKEIIECIGVELTFNPTRIESCYSSSEIQLGKLTLSLVYLSMMSVFGFLIGSALLQRRTRSVAEGKV
jgi:hypothetical protein